MKFLLIIFVIALTIPALARAGDTVDARDIIQEIDNGTSVHYKDIEIVGDLDLSTIKDITTNSMDLGFNTRSFSCHVRSKVEFINCTFQGKFIAYYSNNNLFKNEVYNAVFHESAVFSGCKFLDDAAFKYVKFHESADFKNTEFNRDANFKYTEFQEENSFQKARFQREANFKFTKFKAQASFNSAFFRKDANFKYTDFREGVLFENAEFNGDANFKYTKFPNGVNFSDATFKKEVNFKYTKFSEPAKFDGAKFHRGANCKYTKLNGDSFDPTR